MKKHKNFFKIIAILILISQIELSCKPDEVVINNTPERLFSPALFTPYIDGNVVSLTWVPIANSTYLLELSKDSLLFRDSLKVVPLDGKTIYNFSDLWSNARYSARIKAISKDPKVKDSKFQEITFKTKTENIFYNIADADITANQVILKWVNTKQVTKIVYYIEGTVNPDEKITIDLTDIDKAAGIKEIPGLLSATGYIFDIYRGDMLRGTAFALTL